MMKAKRIVAVVVLGLLMTAGYQVQAQMGEAAADGQVTTHARCKTMMGQGMEGMAGMRHKMMSEHMGDAAFTPEQQAKIDEIEAKYHEELQGKEQVLDAKMAAFDKAWENDATTVAELKVIEDQVAAAKDEYRQVKIKINQEIGAAIGSACYSGACGKMKCDGNCTMEKCGGNCMKKCDGRCGHGPMLHGPM